MSDFLKGALQSAFDQMQDILGGVIAFLPRLVAGLVVLVICLIVIRRIVVLMEKTVVKRCVPASAATMVVNSTRVAGVNLAITSTVSPHP